MSSTEMDHNSNIFSLPKSLSSPRKCSICQKNMYFRAYRCKHCRHRCHKKCVAGQTHSNGGASSRRSSANKTYTGEEHWTKVLQANEVNSNLVGWHCSSKSHYNHVCQCEKSKHKIGRKSRDKGSKDTNIFTSLYSRFCDWVASTKKDSLLGRRTSLADRSQSGSCSGSAIRGGGGTHDTVSFIPGSPDEPHRCYHTSISSEDSELSSFYLPSYSSTCSSLTLTSTSTTTSDYQRPYDPWASSPTIPRYSTGIAHVPGQCDCGAGLGVVATTPVSPFFQHVQYYCQTDNACTTSTSADDSCFSSPDGARLEYDRDTVIKSLDNRVASSKRWKFGKTKHPSVSVWTDASKVKEDTERHFLCATWPPTARRTYSQEDSVPIEKLSDLDESVFTLEETSQDFEFDSSGLKEALGECSIPFADLKFGECVRTGRKHEIFRGRWHGDVMIHTYSKLTDDEGAEFLSEVTKLSMIRHENVALFMGACLESPNFAVVTSVVKETSLYQQIHLKSDKLNAHLRMNIIRQVAQGMGYLHARGIVIRNLNSKNIYLEPKVKLSIMDYGMAEKKYDRECYGCVPRGNLCYIAPEMMRTLHVVSPGLEPTAMYTKATDVYAFSTVLYETMSAQFPFAKMPPEVIIWQIGRGKRQSLKNLKTNNSLRRLTEKCWSRNPENRPTFAEINKELQFNSVLHKRHSSSNPETLNHQGLRDQSSCMFP